MEEEITKTTQVNQMQSTKEKVLKTVLLIITWICLGLCGEINGPALRDLKMRTNSDYEDVARAISGRSIGFFTGAAIGGYLVDKFPRYFNLLIGLSLTTDAGVTIILPFSQRTLLLWFLFVIQGTGEGIINIAGQKIILETWMEKASSPMHALHLGFGIGSFIVPEITNPFLAVFMKLEPNISYSTLLFENNTGLEGSSSTSVEGFDHDIIVRESRIEWAFLIVSIVTLLVATVFFLCQFCSCSINPKRPTQILKVYSERKRGSCIKELKALVKMIDPGTCSGGRRLYSVQMLGLLFLHFFGSVGGERLLGKFIRTYAIDQLDFDGDKATLLNTTFWISFAVGRFAGFVAAKWIPIKILLVMVSTGGLVTAILMNIFDSSTGLWVLTQAFGFFNAPMFPSGVAWGDDRLQMTGMAITFLIFGGSIGGVSFLWIIGYFYENFGYRSFLYLILVYGIFTALVTYVMFLLTFGKDGRFVKDKEKHCQEEQNDHEMVIKLDE